MNTGKSLIEIPYGLAVKIPGFHPGGPGSTPGMGKTTVVFNVIFNTVKPLSSGPPIKRTPSIKRTLSRVPKLTSYISLIQRTPLLGGRGH